MIENITLDELKNLIANAQSEKAINDLINISKYRKSEYNIDNQTSKEILLLSSRFKLLSSKHRQGIINEADFNLEINKINSALVQVIEKLENRIDHLETSDKKSKKVLLALSVAIGVLTIAIIYLVIINKNAKSSETDLNKAKLTQNTTSIRFKADGTDYWLLVDGINIEGRANSSYAGDDFLVYDPETEISYLLPNYKNSKDGKLREAEVLFKGKKILFRRIESIYGLYVEGDIISGRTKSTYIEDDQLVYDPETEITYLLPNCKNINDGILREAKVLFKGEKILFRATESSYWLCVEGNVISGRTEGSYAGDDFIVYDPETDISYLLPNYKNSKDGILREAFKIKKK